MSNNFFKIILVKSIIGRLPKHKKIIKCLGLKKINSYVILKNTPSVKGMIDKINYLVKVESI